MKRFLEWWRRPQMHIHFVEPRKRTNPLAEEAIDSLKCTLTTLEGAVVLVNKLEGDLAQVRAELAAYAAVCMEPDAQVAELERMRLQNTPQTDV
jgi:hypothetical protein